MSSNIQVTKVCQHCKQEFTARKTTTKFCSHNCARWQYKAAKRGEKIENVKQETLRIKTQPLEEIKAKEFLTVSDVAKMLNCSNKTAYSLINNGTLKAVNLAQRKTLIKRTDIDKLFL